MLEINYYARKAYFIVELKGILNYQTINQLQTIEQIIKELQINNLCFKIEQLDYIDQFGLEKIMTCYSLVKKNF